MSRWDCVICRQDAEGGNVWYGGGGWKICRECSYVLVALFAKAVGFSPSWDENGLTVHFDEIRGFLDSMEWDPRWRESTKTVHLGDQDMRELQKRLALRGQP